jgi:hypothetical protein
MGRLRLALLTALSLIATRHAVAQNLAEDPFVRGILGERQGSGEYDGNMLMLTRTWTLELQDQFVQADMRVDMPSGFSFSALMYWRRASAGLYDVVWMDGLGRSQALRATRDPSNGIVSATYLDELAEEGPEWRTWEFESTGSKTYVERPYRVLPGGRELLTVFSFDRSGG